MDPALVLDPEHRVTPIDRGDVCLNYDKHWYATRGIAPPEGLVALTLPRYRDQLVVENAATSTPGLAFMLATIAEFGERWQGVGVGPRVGSPRRNSSNADRALQATPVLASVTEKENQIDSCA